MDKKELKLFKNKIDQLMNHFKAGNYEYVFKQTHLLNKKYPQNSFLANLSGSCLKKVGEFEKSKKFFQYAININKNNIAALNNLGNAHRLLLEYNESEKYFQIALSKNPKHLQSLINLGNLKYNVNKFEEAISLFKKALEIDENSIHSLYNLGLTHQSLGNDNEAVKNYNLLLKKQPKMTIVDRQLSRMIKYTQDNQHFISMLDRLNNLNLGDNELVMLYFSIGKAYEDIKDYEKSFFYIQKGNEIKSKQLVNYNVEKETTFPNQLFKYQDSLNLKYDNTDDEKKLIFILGLPRSGTSLTEQILASHSAVYGCGEVVFLEKLLKKNFYNENKIIPENLNNLDLIKETRKAFYNHINNFYDGPKKIITDKTPQNFMWIGLIQKIFPNSKFIHCRRNPKDNCLSIYKTLFDGDIHWSYDLSNIINYYKNYKSVIHKWKNQFTKSIFEVSYEEMIGNPEENIKKLLNFCELKYEEACLHFYKSKHPIKTMSISQARQPIYNSSVGSGTKFDPFLNDFFKQIESI